VTVQVNETLPLPLSESPVLVPYEGGRRRHQLGRRTAPRVAVLAVALLSTTVLAGVGSLSASAAWVGVYGVILAVLQLAPRPAHRRLRLDAFDEGRDVLLDTALAAILLLACRAIVADGASAGAGVLETWLATAAVLVPGRFGLARMEAHRRRTRGGLPTLIVGAGRVGQLTATRLLAAAEYGLSPVGFLDKSPLTTGATPLPVLGASWDLHDVVRQHGVRHVIFTFSTAPHAVLLRMINECHALGVSVSLVPRLFERVPAKVSVDHVGALPLLSLFPSDPLGRQMRLKYACDRIVAAALLLVAAPVLAAAAAAVVISLGRPILFRQRRVGLDGREFEILKFRSMKDELGEEEADLPPDTAPGGVEASDRRTRVGKILRQTSIDELPQLFNVLRGEMSLVGPRPERPKYVDRFRRNVYRYDERMRVKSGITGWAQIHGLRGQTSLNDRVEWDNYYIENWSFWLDVKILLQTARVLLTFDGA
jgi:exopolysaccharide biosynthesis polyprenyl glycosylphosphotransferase